MRFRLHASALATLAVLLVAGPAAAQGGPPAGEPGQSTLVLRSLEDPNVSSHPNACPFPGANLLLGATLSSILTDAGDSIATSMSIFNPLRLQGAGTGSFWTLRVYTTEN